MRLRALTWVFAYISLAACDDAGELLHEAPVDASVSESPSAASDAGAPAPDAAAPRDAGHTLPPDAPDPLPDATLFPPGEQITDCANTTLPFAFEPEGRDGFDARDAFWAMWFAERAMFHDDPRIPAELAALGFDQFEAVEVAAQGLQAYVARRDDVVVMAFRGSTELLDWIGDFNFPLDDGAPHRLPGRVHRGFIGALEPAWDALFALLQRFTDRHQPLWVTGHSLGGAQATLAAVRLAAIGWKLAPFYTFGAPRAGDEAFARRGEELLGGRAYRVVNELDLVPRLPPTAAGADNAAPVVPLAGGTAADFLRGLDYLHVAQMWWFEAPAGHGLTEFAPLDDSQDVPYWADMAQNGTISLLAKNLEQGKRHDPHRYLCRLLGEYALAAE